MEGNIKTFIKDFVPESFMEVPTYITEKVAKGGTEQEARKREESLLEQ